MGTVRKTQKGVETECLAALFFADCPVGIVPARKAESRLEAGDTTHVKITETEKLN